MRKGLYANELFIYILCTAGFLYTRRLFETEIQCRFYRKDRYGVR